MFEKTFLEIFVVQAYWFNFTPFMYWIFEGKNWIQYDGMNLENTIISVFVFVILNVMFFVGFYRIVMCAYKKIKEIEKAKLAKYKQKYMSSEKQG